MPEFQQVRSALRKAACPTSQATRDWVAWARYARVSSVPASRTVFLIGRMRALISEQRKWLEEREDEQIVRNSNMPQVWAFLGTL